MIHIVCFFLFVTVSSAFVAKSFGQQQKHFLRSMTNDEIDFEELQYMGFTKGMCETLEANKEEFAMRFWILDNSGSMAERPSVFAPNRFSVAEDMNSESDLATARNIMMKATPMGTTPLARRIIETRKEIEHMELQGQKVAIVIATDGLPTDDEGYGGDEANAELGRALQSLASLPVWVTIRLCTDDTKVVDFYSRLDQRLELSMDVLDDYLAEAKEVHNHNKWINYALPIHRMREHGMGNRLFDLLDERAFTNDELRDFSVLLYGASLVDGMPDPNRDWKGFKRAVEEVDAKEMQPWNPITKKPGPWMKINPTFRF